MSSREDIARKLAKITGKPVEEYLNEKTENTREVHTDDVQDEILQVGELTQEIREYLALFKGSELCNGRILNGRQMTKKEYLKFTRNMTKAELMKHPLVHKFFRSENQIEPNFTRFIERFK